MREAVEALYVAIEGTRLNEHVLNMLERLNDQPDVMGHYLDLVGSLGCMRKAMALPDRLPARAQQVLREFEGDAEARERIAAFGASLQNNRDPQSAVDCLEQHQEAIRMLNKVFERMLASGD